MRSDQEEPYESRDSRTDLREPGGETPLGDSTYSSLIFNGPLNPRLAWGRGDFLFCINRMTKCGTILVSEFFMGRVLSDQPGDSVAGPDERVKVMIQLSCFFVTCG
jgi:hypothetical protein